MKNFQFRCDRKSSDASTCETRNANLIRLILIGNRVEDIQAFWAQTKTIDGVDTKIRNDKIL